VRGGKKAAHAQQSLLVFSQSGVALAPSDAAQQSDAEEHLDHLDEKVDGYGAVAELPAFVFAHVR